MAAINSRQSELWKVMEKLKEKKQQQIAHRRRWRIRQPTMLVNASSNHLPQTADK